MKLMIDGHEQNLISIKLFRQQHHLPDTFGIAQFEPKDYAGLGSLDKAGAVLNTLRTNLLQNIPTHILIPNLIQQVDQLQFQFQTELFNINDAIALQDVEVEFAVAGFGDVLRRLIYRMIPATTSKTPMPPFDSIYYGWLNDSVRLSSHIHDWQHDDEQWHIQIINHVYGRAGLRIAMRTDVVYVADGVYACPAEGFMYGLLKEVALQLWNALP